DSERFGSHLPAQGQALLVMTPRSFVISQRLCGSAHDDEYLGDAEIVPNFLQYIQALLAQGHRLPGIAALFLEQLGESPECPTNSAPGFCLAGQSQAFLKSSVNQLTVNMPR